MRNCHSNSGQQAVIGSLPLESPHAAPFDFQSRFGVQPNRLGISEAFLFEDASGERVGGIIIFDRHGALQDNRTMIILVVCEMHCATADFGTPFQHSSDGIHNHRYPPESAYRHFPFERVTVNGLVIEGAETEVQAYYANHVISGPGAFVEIANGYADYARAMKRKLLRELQDQLLATR